MLINGEFIDRSKHINIRNPANNEIVDTVPHGTLKDVKNAICAANKASKVTRELPSRLISEHLYDIYGELSKNSRDFEKLITLDCGKPIKDSIEEVKRSKQTILLSAEESKRIYGETIPMDACIGGEGIMGFTTRIPLGVVGAITPFNYPLNLIIHKVAPAIAAKNTVVVKPSTKAPLAALKFAEIASNYLEKGVLNVITGSGREVGDEIVTSEHIDKISFTGSVETGLSISKRSGMKKLTLELGGNDPLLVLEDADIDKAVDAAVRGSYLYAGQVCIGVKRIILHKEIADEFTHKFVQSTEKLKVGDPMDIKTDVGPLIDENAAITVDKDVNQAIEDGAELLCGGKRDGSFYYPTVLDNVSSHMNIVQEETFGPVSPLIHVKSVDEAIDVANDTKYGLQAGVFTSNINTALKVANKIEAGSVIINKQSTYRADNMPFGGCKMSGMGKEGIKYAIEEMTKPKLYVFNPIP